MDDPFALTRAEAEVAHALAAAWNAYLALPIVHSDDQNEFRALIHAAQDKVLGRVGRRQINGGSV